MCGTLGWERPSQTPQQLSAPAIKGTSSSQAGPDSGLVAVPQADPGMGFTTEGKLSCVSAEPRPTLHLCLRGELDTQKCGESEGRCELPKDTVTIQDWQANPLPHRSLPSFCCGQSMLS